MVTIVDPLSAICSLVREDTALAAIHSGRVFGIELPESEAQSMPRSCVVITHSGGLSSGQGARSTVPITTSRMDVKCFGQTTMNCSHLHWNVHYFLVNLTRTFIASSIIHSAVVSGGTLALRDPDTDWPYFLASYDIIASNEY